MLACWRIGREEGSKAEGREEGKGGRISVNKEKLPRHLQKRLVRILEEREGGRE